MKKSHFGTIVSVCLLAALIGLIGCSGDDAIVADLPDSAAGSPLTTYFPVSDGYTTTYQVTANGASDRVTFEIDGQAASPSGNMWVFVAELANGSKDTSYLRVTSQGVYHYDGLQSDPETILKAPLEIGSSWDRFGQNTPEADAEAAADTINLSLGNLDALLKGDGVTSGLGGADGSGYEPWDDAIAAKTFPTEGRLRVRVQAEEQLNLSNGDHYSYCLRLSNVQQDGKSNYYWYAPGVGLVRYALGATASTYPDGDIVGELVDYGTR